jgi:non-heme chloroperoxidase
MKTFSFIATALCAALLVTGIAIGVMLGLGGPGEPPPLASINNPFKAVDYNGLPALSYYGTRRGELLAYRYYAPAKGPARNPVVLVHGSSASSKSMHVMARGFAAAGHPTYALDVRGHGDSGPKGDIDHVGQLEDDLQDFVKNAALAPTATLVGFSSGGGFVLRVAGSPMQGLFANYLLLSPFIHQNSPTSRRDSGGWVSVGMPRYIVLSILDQFGITVFSHLPVMRFALNDEARAFLTPSYSFALAQNFRPYNDYTANIRAVGRPMAVVAGRDDELFRTERFAALFSAEGKAAPVSLVAGAGHIELILKPVAIKAAIAAVDRLNEKSSSSDVASFAGSIGR